MLEVVEAFKSASKVDIPYKIVPRRAGDIAKCFADVSYAKELLGWSATKSIDEMCEDSWRWQENNPNGYERDNNAIN